MATYQVIIPQTYATAAGLNTIEYVDNVNSPSEAMQKVAQYTNYRIPYSTLQAVPFAMYEGTPLPSGWIPGLGTIPNMAVPVPQTLTQQPGIVPNLTGGSEGSGYDISNPSQTSYYYNVTNPLNRDMSTGPGSPPPPPPPQPPVEIPPEELDNAIRAVEAMLGDGFDGTPFAAVLGQMSVLGANGVDVTGSLTALMQSIGSIPGAVVNGADGPELSPVVMAALGAVAMQIDQSSNQMNFTARMLELVKQTETNLKIAELTGQSDRYIADAQNRAAQEVARINGLSAEAVAALQGRSAEEVARLTGMSAQEVADIQGQYAVRIANLTGLADRQIAEIQAASAQKVAQITSNPFNFTPEQQLAIERLRATGGLTPEQLLQQEQIRATGGLSPQAYAELQQAIARGGVSESTLREFERLKQSTAIQTASIGAKGQVDAARAAANPYGLSANAYSELQMAIARGGVSEQTLREFENLRANSAIEQARLSSNPYGFNANSYAALQESLARGGISAEQVLQQERIRAGSNLIPTLVSLRSNPAALGSLVATGGLGNVERAIGELSGTPSLYGSGSFRPTGAPSLGSAGSYPVGGSVTPQFQSLGSFRGAPSNLSAYDIRDRSGEELNFLAGQASSYGITPSDLSQRVASNTPAGL